MGLSQEQVARSIGMSFQQVQKYESGSSRIAAGILFRLSKILNVSVDYFYEGLDESGSSMADINSEAYQLIRMFGRITNRRQRRALLVMIEQIAGELDAERAAADPDVSGGGEVH